MKHMRLMLTMLAVAAMLALPACSTKHGAAAPESSGTNNSGGSMGSGSGY